MTAITEEAARALLAKVGSYAADPAYVAERVDKGWVFTRSDRNAIIGNTPMVVGDDGRIAALTIEKTVDELLAD